VLVDRGLGLAQCGDPRVGQVQRLLAPVARRALTAHVVAFLQPVDDGHRRRPVHPQAPAERDLRDARVVVDQPQRRDLLLGQPEIDEGIAEMAVHRAMREADAQPEDVVESAELVRVVVGQSRRVHEPLSNPKQLA
jgi:hypothetical protein